MLLLFLISLHHWQCMWKWRRKEEAKRKPVQNIEQFLFYHDKLFYLWDDSLLPYYIYFLYFFIFIFYFCCYWRVLGPQIMFCVCKRKYGERQYGVYCQDTLTLISKTIRTSFCLFSVLLLLFFLVMYFFFFFLCVCLLLFR